MTKFSTWLTRVGRLLSGRTHAQKCTITKGHIHSPHFIFLRAAGKVSDAEVLRALGMDNFVSSPLQVDWSKPHVYLTEDEAWIHIADDWKYSLFYKFQGSAGKPLSERFPEVAVFACSVGDCDRSFDFEYYASGQLIRRYVVEDPLFDRLQRIVKADVGTPLSLERSLAAITEDEQDYVLSLASGFGVHINHRLEAIRCYVAP